jgi:hypothetical protein
MNFKKLTLALGTLALAVVSAAPPNVYHFTLDDAAWFGATHLKAGEYKIQVEGTKAVITSGKKDVAEVPVKIEQADHKILTNQIFMKNENNKQQVQEIRIGGSTTRIVLTDAVPAGE